MSTASPNPHDLRFDLRLIEQRIRRGTVTADEYKKFLEALPDDADHGEPCKVQFVASFGDKGYSR